MAVTIVIVGVALVSLLQALNNSKLTAAHTRNAKLANQLALFTLGQVEAGLFQEEELSRYSANYAEQEQPDFFFEILVGEESFTYEDDSDGRFDSFAHRADRREEQLEEQDEDREEEDLPFEKVKIRVTFPGFKELKNELVLERWIPWEQVYGPPEDAEEEDDN